jgi:hypothetical protein
MGTLGWAAAGTPTGNQPSPMNKLNVDYNYGRKQKDF